MVLKQKLSASKITTCQEAIKKAEQIPITTSLPGFSTGYVFKVLYAVIIIRILKVRYNLR